MSNYYNVLTNLGRAKITELITSQNEFKNIQIAFGDGNGLVPTPNPVRTSLVNEVHRRPADKLERHPTLTNNIIVDVVIPASVGSFWIREFGIYFDGVLICHGSLPPSYKEASENSVNTYRLKPYINVESDRLNVVEIESDLINATESWTQENFINRSEIVDNLTTNDANKVASAGTVKELQDNKLDKTDLKDASTEQKGVVQVNNTLTSTSTTEALTAAQGKVLNDRFLNDFLNLKSENGYQKLPNGLIIQWGCGVDQNASDYAQTNAQTISFPIAFPNACLNLSVSTYSTGISLDAMYQITSISKTNFKTHLNTLNNGGGLGKPYFFAIGC